MMKISYPFLLSAIILFSAGSCRKVTPVEWRDGVAPNTTCSDATFVDNQIQSDYTPAVTFTAETVTSEVVSGHYVLTAVNGNKTVRLTFGVAVPESPVYVVSYPSELYTGNVTVDYINGTTERQGYYGDVHVKLVNGKYQFEFCNVWMTNSSTDDRFTGRFLSSN